MDLEINASDNWTLNTNDNWIFKRTPITYGLSRMIPITIELKMMPITIKHKMILMTTGLLVPMTIAFFFKTSMKIGYQ